MRTMTLEPIVLVVETAASPDLTWEFLTNPDRVASWFTDVSPLGNVGDAYRLDFGDGSVVEGEILAVEPGRSFTHAWTWTDAEPGEPTIVSWVVEPRTGGGSRVELVHEGWDEAGADQTLRDEHESYWTGYLDDLRDLLEDAAAEGGR